MQKTKVLPPGQGSVDVPSRGVKVSRDLVHKRGGLEWEKDGQYLQ